MASQQIKFVMGKQMIELLAPIVGIDQNRIRTIDVHASYKDVAVFDVELLALNPPAPADGETQEGAAP